MDGPSLAGGRTVAVLPSLLTGKDRRRFGTENMSKFSSHSLPNSEWKPFYTIQRPYHPFSFPCQASLTNDLPVDSSKPWYCKSQYLVCPSHCIVHTSSRFGLPQALAGEWRRRLRCGSTYGLGA